MKSNCIYCKKEVSLQKVKNNFNLCYLCNGELSNMKELKSFKVERDIKIKKTKSKKTNLIDDSKVENNYKYPALEFVIGIYKIFSGIAFVCSFIAFGYMVGDMGLFQALVFMLCSWLIIISAYSYAELIRIFIRIEENTRK